MDPLGIVFTASVVLAGLIFIFSADDFIVDVWTGLVVPPLPTAQARDGPDRAVPPKSSKDGTTTCGDHSHRPFIGVFIANWHEADVLPSMVAGNLAAITYPNFRLFLGVYPNDLDTVAAARACANAFPDKVSVIVNSLSGPTSKGQMLNEMFRQVYGDGWLRPDLVLLHDSEDIIDPRAFDLYARHSQRHAFVQIPVFSLDAKKRSLTAATYMDEFADRHLREMRLRSHLGTAVPSAGVGTMLRLDLVEHFLRTRREVLRSGTVTEDYILGWEAHEAGFSCAFVAERDPYDGHIIATREYFPKDLLASVRQKSRWIYGIGFEGARQLGWRAKPIDLFFLYRDRKGLIANIVPALALGILAFLAMNVDQIRQLNPDWMATLGLLLSANLGFTAIRYFHRVRSHAQVYGRLDLLQVALRWLLAIIVNAWATTRAWRSFIVDSRFATQPIVWVKTAHEVPEVFMTAEMSGTPRAIGLHATREITKSAGGHTHERRLLPANDDNASETLVRAAPDASPSRVGREISQHRRASPIYLLGVVTGLLNAASAGLLIAMVVWTS